jgi:hypothetical protein
MGLPAIEDRIGGTAEDRVGVHLGEALRRVSALGTDADRSPPTADDEVRHDTLGAHFAEQPDAHQFLTSLQHLV